MINKKNFVTYENSFWIVYAIGLFIILVPILYFSSKFGLYNEKRLTQILLFFMLGGGFLASTSIRNHWLSTFRSIAVPARIGLFTILGLGVVSSLLAPAPWYAFVEMAHFGLLFVLAGAVASAVRHGGQKTEQLLLAFIAMSALLYTIHFFVGYVMYLTMPAIKLWPEGATGFANIRFFNQYQTWTLPLLAVPILSLPKGWRWARVAMFFVLSLWWALVLASNVRGTVIAMGIAATGVGVVFWPRAKRWLTVQIAALLGGVILYGILFYGTGETGPQVVERLGDPSQYSQRLDRWKTALEIAWENLWLGAGPMHYAWPPNHFTRAAHPHNAFLQWLAEWGLPSTLLMSGLVCWGGWSWIDQERKQTESESESSDAIKVALVASVLAGAAHAMVSGVIVMPLSQILLVLVLGWAWGRYQRTASSNFTCDGRIRYQVALCAFLIAAMGVVSVSVQDLQSSQESRRAFLDASHHHNFYPRYWQQGFIGVRDPEVMERARHDR